MIFPFISESSMKWKEVFKNVTRPNLFNKFWHHQYTRIYYRMGQAASWNPIVYYRLNCRCQYGFNWLVPDRIICVIYRIVCVLLYFGWVTSTGIISYYLIGLIKYCCVFRLSNFNFICSRERRFKLECCRCFREEVITDAIYPDTEWDVEPQEEQLSVRSRLCDWLKR